MFYTAADFVLHHNTKTTSNQSEQQQQQQRLKAIQEFCNSSICRRVLILRYFNEEEANCDPRINCCDNCRQAFDVPHADDLFDFGTDASTVLKAVKVFNGYCGIAKPVLFLRASLDKKLQDYR